eukprot:2659759-Prymnesium_polylepis.1
MDSDVAVLRNVDHLLERMLARPVIGELKTPQGCLNEGGASGAPNTGVWAVRPSAVVFNTLMSWMHWSMIDCNVGLQDVHQAFFSRLPPRAKAKFGVFEQVALPVKYNMKAGDWARCLSKLNFTADEVFITHWSGKRKPRRGLYPNQHPTQRRALEMYLDAYCTWGEMLNATDSTCDAPPSSTAAGAAVGPVMPRAGGGRSHGGGAAARFGSASMLERTNRAH